ncbi:MAG TPA: hypothetical protein VG271_18220 [Beijerinckiaceae bacterium]|nr:hypothetical protein [Beijerinckiaceae bacterium]
MSKFIIQPHGRLQEWIADEKGYFRDEGLDYEFQHGLSMDRVKRVDGTGKIAEIRSGAFEDYERGGGNKGVKSDISCACHWTVNQASTQQVGRMWRKAYVATSGGIMVPPDSSIKKPEDLADQEIAVGYHSGSHFTAIQSLEPFLSREQIKLKFVGSVWARVDAGVARDVPAISAWGNTHQVLEQFGFRKIVDTSFMIAFMFPHEVDERDVEKYMNGLRRAQMDLDLQPEKYKHYYANEIPERYRSKVDVRLFSPGERIVFLPYTDATHATTQTWLQERELFEEASPTAA